MTDEANEVTDIIESELPADADDFEGMGSGDMLNLSIEDKMRALLFGPTPDLIEKINRRLDKMSDTELRAYGTKTANNYLADPVNEASNPEDFIASGEKQGIIVPDLVKTVIREVVGAAPRDTFESAMAKVQANRAEFGEDDAYQQDIANFQAEQERDDPGGLYERGYELGKQFQKGWNTAQFTGEEIITLAFAEGGYLSEASKDGFRDAYAHYTPQVV